MSSALTPAQRADRLASRQYAAISRRQALDAGLTRHEIDEYLRSGRWRPATRGVYAVTAAPVGTAAVRVRAAPALVPPARLAPSDEGPRPSPGGA